MIEILIPTYNRAKHLIKNIEELEKEVVDSGILDKVELIISDNCSEDETQELLAGVIKRTALKITTYRQSTNVGGEENCIFLMQVSRGQYVMYLGDDDYLPLGYLKFVIDTITTSETICIIPGFSYLDLDGKITVARNAAFSIKTYNQGFATVCKLSHFGHQLSGLTVKKDFLLERYLEDHSLRNMYPFIFFITYCMLNGKSCYAPKYKILVTQGNKKYWSYDNSGLLVDALRNYKIAFPESNIKYLIASVSLIKNQSWRLGVGWDIRLAITAFIHLMESKELDIYIKTAIILIYPYCYVKKACQTIFRHIIRTIGRYA